MKRWAFVVVILYTVIFAVLILPLLTVCFLPFEIKESALTIKGPEMLKTLDGSSEAFISWQFWALLIIMLAGQAALLLVPVDIANKRPTAKKALILPVAVCGAMMALLMVGATASISEFFIRQNEGTGMILCGLGNKGADIKLSQALREPTFQRAIGVMAFGWLLWALIFFRWSRNMEPKFFIERQCRFLYRGSILELLVAVPAHVVARSRGYCCAGFSTFAGIVFGISVMLFSFGPGVFFLFVERWRRLHPPKTE